MKEKKTRFWEIDSLRGIAIVVMIFFHFIYSLYFFGIYDYNINSPELRLFFHPFRIIFLFLVGVCLTISYNKAKHFQNEKELFFKFFLRGLKIFILGMLITVVTFFFVGRGFIVFGVLHCIGISIILAYPFISYKFFNLIIGLVFVFFGIVLSFFTFDFPWFLWAGFVPSGFFTVDYFPLFPWFGVVLLGVFFGNIVYKDGKRVFDMIDLSNIFVVRMLCFLGRNSLLIYFIHQPVIILIIELFFLINN